MTNPIVGGVSKQPSFMTGLEDFDIPWDFGSGSNQSGSSGSIGSSGSSGSATSFPEYETQESEVSGGSGIDLQKMQTLMQMQKTRDDFARMVKQAKFFLPRTLEQISGQYGTQGSYWSSGRREAQQEAAQKTKFDLGQAKADAEFELKMQYMQLAQANQAEQEARSG